jgi:hypothetical protein
MVGIERNERCVEEGFGSNNLAKRSESRKIRRAGGKIERR